MKIFAVALLIFLISCSQVKDSENTTQLPETEKAATLSHQQNAEIILEVASNFESPVSWIKGKIIDFRLDSDGFVEFDDCPFESPTGKQIIVEESCERNQVKINESELKEVNQILSSSEFKGLEKKYKKIVSSCDAIPEVTVTTKNKIIKIAWCDSLTEPANSPEFPKILTKIFQFNRAVRNRALGKEVISP